MRALADHGVRDRDGRNWCRAWRDGPRLTAAFRTAHRLWLQPACSHQSREFPRGREGFVTSAARIALCACGTIAGIGWWTLYRFGAPLVSIRKATEERGPRMPFLTTIAHDLLQIVTVGLGSPLGREVAPREVGAVLARWLSEHAGLSPESSRIMIACGAGAGLAAIYNVPFGGTLFTLEVLLGTFNWAALIPALATSVIATVVAWLGLGNTAQYALPSLSISPSLVLWSIATGPVFGFGAY